jgi:magnesium transporter
MKAVAELLEAFSLDHPAEAALAFYGSSDSASEASPWSQLSARAQAAVLAHLPPGAAARVLAGGDVTRAAAALKELPADIAAPLVRTLEPAVRTEILATMGGDAQPVRRLLSYAEGTAGALMDPRVPAFRSDLRTADVLEGLRRDPKHAIYYVYAVDAGGRLVGVLNLRELMLAEPSAVLGSVMKSDVDALPATATEETVQAHRGWQRAHALPVVDGGRYVGTIRYRTLRALERQPVLADRRHELRQTTRELGELYAVGWSSLLAWGAGLLESALRMEDEP